MTSAVFIYVKDFGIAKTVVSIEENTQKLDKIIFLVNSSTSDTEKNILNSVFTGCCDSKIETLTVEEFEIKTLNNYVYIYNDKATKEQLINFAIKHINVDIIFTATSSVLFDKNYFYKIISSFEDPSIGAVYTDYIENGIERHLEYLQPMITGKINIKELALRSKFLDSEIKSEIFENVIGLFNKSIIRHIPEKLYAL